MRAVAIAIGLLAAACAGEVRTIAPTNDARSSGPPAGSSSSDVAITRGEAASCDGEAMGVVDVPATEDEAATRDAVRARAAALGADEVSDLRRVTVNGEDHVVATASRCRSLREERPYDVVARIDVPETIAGLDAAFGELRARAYELHADLVLDVHVSSDAEAHAHVTGVAIKYR
jgi:hypothetical protein